jgi:ParB/RepB/Spo0J family partition protein
MASTTEAPEHTQAELASVPLTEITSEHGFNPRGEVQEDDELRALAATIRNHGCILPIRVRREGDRFVLVAGERRYRAAQIAGLTEIPASILPEQASEGPAERLTEALIENELRSELDPVHRALAYRALLDQGLTVRGIAERLGGSTGRRGREQRIKEHLEILNLNEELKARVGAGEIPLLAVKALRQLTEIHPDLATAAVRAVEPAEEYEEPYSWAEVAAAPLQSAINCCEQLPPGVYSTRESYPLDRFELSEQAKADLAVLAEHGHAPEQIRFTGELVERAPALDALHEAGWCQIIAGQDIADTLAADWLAAARKHSEEHAAAASPPNGAEHGADAGEAAERLREQAAAERHRQREQRDSAVSYNLRLGVLAFKHLARVKVDERVLRVLASVDVGGSLHGLAARGARLTAPGWVTQADQNGRAKTTYLEPHDAQQRALEFLDGAKSAGEIAGRAITLIALAVHADEEAVAASNRSYHEVSFRGPFAEQAQADLTGLIAERIRQGELPVLDERLGRGPDVGKG